LKTLLYELYGGLDGIVALKIPHRIYKRGCCEKQ